MNLLAVLWLAILALIIMWVLFSYPLLFLAWIVFSSLGAAMGIFTVECVKRVLSRL